MTELLFTLTSFIVALALLIAVHEFGHFWVAKRLGVKVLRFSIGFGKPLLQFTKGADQTEYVLAGIPLGGYVKMLDEREGDVAEHELHRAFNRQPVTKRIAIVAAGPLFNLAFAVIAYWVMFIVGVPGIKPVLGEISPGTPAYMAGLHQGDEILAVDEQRTPTWSALLKELLPYAVDHQGVTLRVDRGGRTLELTYPLDRLEGDFDPETLRSQLGLYPWRPDIPALIEQVVDNSAGSRAGLRSGDVIVSIDDKAIHDWQGVVDIVRDNPGRAMAIEYRREGNLLNSTLRPESRSEGDSQIGYIGVAVQVEPGQFDHLRSEMQHAPLEAIPAALQKTWDTSRLTLTLMGRMVTGNLSLKHVSGPISIAQYAGASAEAGFSQFFEFLAIVSISLGILNLLPIPVLDGGHLFFYSIELLKGSPLSEEAQLVGQKVGISLLLCIMLLAFYNDIMRLAG